MKVGVCSLDTWPESGGGFTFENDVFRAFTQLAGESVHNFIVFAEAKDLVVPSEHIQFVPLGRNLVQRLILKVCRTATGVIRKIRYPNRIFWVRSSHEKLILEHGIEVMWYLGPYCLSMDIPYFITYFDLQHRLQPYFPELSTKGVWDMRERHYGIVLRRASMIIVGTEVGKAEIERFYQIPAERIKVLPMPTPQFALNAFSGSDKQILAKYRIPENYLFYPAQFWSHKNHAGMLQAVRMLRDKWNIFSPVVFTGSDQGNRQYIENLAAELNLSAQVHFLGFVPEKDLISLYHYAFALIFPTFFGPNNLPPLEAFALGCPVIASNVSGAQEQLGDAALLVDPKSPEQMVLAIKSLYDKPSLRQSLIQRGLETAMRWTARDYVRGVFSMIDEFEPIRRCWHR